MFVLYPLIAAGYSALTGWSGVTDPVSPPTGASPPAGRTSWGPTCGRTTRTCPACSRFPPWATARRFVLSPDNPYPFRGRHARGVGSPHTPPGYVWPIALTAGTDLMHESFDPDEPARFTHEWFGWADALFAEFVMTHLDLHPRPGAVPSP